MRLVVAFVGLVINFALPIFAQQTSTPDPQLRERLVALVKKFDETWNNNDAVALSRHGTAGPWRGYNARIYVPEADTWKIRMEYSVVALEHR